MADYESVDSRKDIREPGANLDRESAVSTFLGVCVKGEERSGSKIVHRLRDRENLHKIL